MKKQCDHYFAYGNDGSLNKCEFCGEEKIIKQTNKMKKETNNTRNAGRKPIVNPVKKEVLIPAARVEEFNAFVKKIQIEERLKIN
jgi:hypothetical protein